MLLQLTSSVSAAASGLCTVSGSATLQHHYAKVDGEKAVWLVHFSNSARVCSMLYRAHVDCSSRREWMEHKKANT